MTTQDITGQLEDAAARLRTYPPTTIALRALQAAKNAIEAEQARLVAEMIDHGDHEADGCSGPKTWLRDQLHLDTRAANDLINAAETFRDLPEVMDAATAGDISAEHVKLFTHARRHVGVDQTQAVVDELLDVARTHSPSGLRGVVNKLRDTVYPDSLEQAWIDGMSRQDIRLSPVPEGFHVTGFVGAELGVKLKTLLHSLGTPRQANDDRDTAERRVSGLENLLDAVLAHGLPTINGIRPHLTLTVDLADLVEHPTTATAELAGFGTISNTQMRLMLETADLTPILTGGKHAVLDVGRRHRFATDHQKRAIDNRQNHQCAEPGCTNGIDHYHHIEPWKNGGHTNLDTMIGVCQRTHTAIHQGLLDIDPLTRATRRVLRQVRRRPAA